MSKTYKCIVCLDHGFIAVHPDDPTDIETMEGKLWQDIEHRRLRKCECRGGEAYERKKEADRLRGQQR